MPNAACQASYVNDRIGYYLGHNGTFSAIEPVSMVAKRAQGVRAADFNNDGTVMVLPAWVTH